MLVPYLTGLAFSSLASASAVPPLGYERKLLHDYLGKRGVNGSSSCLNDAAPTTVAPKANIWAQISPEDNLAVWNLLHLPTSGLNLTSPDSAKPSDNYVYVLFSVFLKGASGFLQRLGSGSTRSH
jgi:primary-amine oxidase